MNKTKTTYTIKSTWAGDLYIEPEEVILSDSFRAKLEAVERIEELLAIG